MPRRDGLPTNREMVVDFNALSRTAYVDAYNSMVEDGLPDAFQDKPLDAMFLHVAKPVPQRLRLDGGVTGERLEVDPLQEGDVDMIRHTLGFRDTPEEVVEHYRAVARRIGDTTLHAGLDIATVLPTEGVDASYTAYYPGGRTRHISTFKEKPSKASIAAGKFFAEQAIQEINHPLVDRAFDVADFAEFVVYIRNAAEQQGGLIDHHLSFRMVPNLPLNGHEPREFLQGYADKMLARVTDSAERLEKMKDLGGPEVIIENAQSIYDSAKASYERAQELLGKK